MGRYLVTGCAGFIAANVCRLLLAAGHEVVGVDNLNHAYDARLKDWRLAQLASPRFTYECADIGQIDELRAKLAPHVPADQPFAAAINLAARAGVRPSMLDPRGYYQANVIGTINILELCREWGVKKCVLASSSSVYGDSTDIPYREDQSVARPVSPYAASKQAGETLAYSYHHLHCLDISVLRFFTVYGPAGRPDMSIFRFVRNIAEGTTLTLWGDGNQRRDFTYVDDIAAGVIASLKPIGYEIFNLGGDRPASVNEVLAMLAQRLGKEPLIERRPAHPADVPQTWADISKAKRLLNWSPQVGLEQGLAASVEWYLANRDFAMSLDLGD